MFCDRLVYYQNHFLNLEKDMSMLNSSLVVYAALHVKNIYVNTNMKDYIPPRTLVRLPKAEVEDVLIKGAIVSFYI